MIPALPPPCGIPAKAFFHVMARAKRKTSRVLTVGGHANSPNRRPDTGVINHNDPAKSAAWLINVDNLLRSKIVAVFLKDAVAWSHVAVRTS